MKKILITVEDEQKEKILKIMQEKGFKTMSKTIRKVIDEYILQGISNEVQGSKN